MSFLKRGSKTKKAHGQTQSPLLASRSGLNTAEVSWDPSKAKSNKNKHGISFEKAKTVFFDPNARLIDDPEHSDEEERFVMIGLSTSVRTLVVCHCYREAESHIRIISARKATKKETKAYEGYLS